MNESRRKLRLYVIPNISKSAKTRKNATKKAIIEPISNAATKRSFCPIFFIIYFLLIGLQWVIMSFGIS